MNRSDLTLNELMVFNSELRSAEKSAAVAYVLLIGGHLGAHRFYLKRTGSAIVQLVLFLLAAVGYFAFEITAGFNETLSLLLAILLFALPGIALTVWIIVDLFLMSGMVREYNKTIERELLRQIFAYRREGPPPE